MKTFQTITNILFVAALLLVAGLFLSTLIPIPGNIEIKIVKSGSMEPAIKTGGIVVIKPVDSYHVGDVITFGKETRTVIPTTHRIVSVEEENGVMYFVTKGDANEEADPSRASERDVIGKMLLTVPYAGFILDFAKQPIGFTALIAIPAALIILYEFFEIIEEIQRMYSGKKRRADVLSIEKRKCGERMPRRIPAQRANVLDLRAINMGGTMNTRSCRDT
ncbi:MAG: signal peptidase I [Candidatus Yonathbacteria bacterium CG_4_10_14_3_um_filter_47_65]|uniref:Signal peptidase I n=2 Tax=Parcubacteria group TaxID=1794811 RepID=A0A2M8D6P1_9BACT|nr:MAG: signal peptidase I [Candidatus Nomurabacteria bacterium CG1_02_47_685]PIP03678.1 MAG: signal peptidase I [Candidatus Yonathbacteria bacterium CG23_combo_of_CG06-09_8_20_14_all_46_18]PIQ31732.1 MAG: signal peptidase I [Candidatus Yonathbacteria bacterium CG17_big_fil_post_rev_8_21_14_2_50_46_19]PIX56271.1 MAG: signal peptidase I [Candidatus Yonathbacteria bacterium CG_4_10_14_3_um_filter_47_65]PIY57932.1 MAG: signal peptidase I [Candidatus Yonathbacteria bacterium CG_4_10_14_0_8_um_filte